VWGRAAGECRSGYLLCWLFAVLAIILIIAVSVAIDATALVIDINEASQTRGEHT